MSVHLLSHPGRRPTVRNMWTASWAWLWLVAAVVVAGVLWGSLHPPDERADYDQWQEGILVGGIVLTSAWLYVCGPGRDASNAQLATVGTLWVTLSFLLDYAYRVYAVSHLVMRFLVHLFVGNSGESRGWLWNLFLALQLTSPLAMGMLKHALSRRAHAWPRRHL